MGRINGNHEGKGMKLNKNKTKQKMMVNRNKNTNPLNHKMKGVQIKVVKKFKYLRNKIK